MEATKQATTSGCHQVCLRRIWREHASRHPLVAMQQWCPRGPSGWTLFWTLFWRSVVELRKECLLLCTLPAAEPTIHLTSSCQVEIQERAVPCHCSHRCRLRPPGSMVRPSFPRSLLAPLHSQLAPTCAEVVHRKFTRRIGSRHGCGRFGVEKLFLSVLTAVCPLMMDMKQQPQCRRLRQRGVRWCCRCTGVTAPRHWLHTAYAPRAAAAKSASNGFSCRWSAARGRWSASWRLPSTRRPAARGPCTLPCCTVVCHWVLVGNVKALRAIHKS